jgi:hypothetical protein
MHEECERNSVLQKFLHATHVSERKLNLGFGSTPARPLRSPSSLQSLTSPRLDFKCCSLYATSRKVAGSIPDEVNGFLNYRNSPSCSMALMSAQLLMEMSTRNLPGSKGLPARKADDITLDCEPMVWKMGVSTSHNPMGLHVLLQR